MVGLLLAVPALGLFVILSALRNRRLGGSMMWLCAGVALPVAGWELFRFAELGSISAYVQWWGLQAREVLSQSGAVETFSSWGPRLQGKGASHLELLSSTVGTPQLIMMIFLCVPWLVLAVLWTRNWLKNDLQRAFYVGVLLIAAIGYFFWWLLIGPTYMAWLRRIMNGLLLQQILLILSIGALGEAYRRSQKLALPMRLLSATLAASLLVAEGYLTWNGDLVVHPPALDEAGIDQLAVAQAMRDLPPDAKIFGWGWWKAPQLALFSGREIMDYYRWAPATIDALPHKYLVLDATVKSMANQLAREIDDILAAASYRIVVDRPGGRIYALDKVLPYAPFTENDRNSKEVSASYNPVSGSSSAARGLYPAIDSTAWARPEFALLLRRDGQTRLSLSVMVPPELLASAARGEALSLGIASPGCLNVSVSLLQAGPQTITEPLGCPPTPESATIEFSFRVNGHLPFVQKIEADPRRRAFQIVSAQLQ